MNMRSTFRARNDTGFTLIEVLVALLVLGIGLLGLAMLQTTGLRFNTNSYSRTQGTYLAYDVIEKMRANVAAFNSGNYDIADATVANNAIATYATCKSSSCACDTSACTASALAQYDLGQWYDQQDRMMPGVKDASNLSPSVRATIVRVANKATVTVYWLEQERNAASGNPNAKSQVWEADIYQ